MHIRCSSGKKIAVTLWSAYLLNSRKSPRKSHFLCNMRSCVTEMLEFSNRVSKATDGMFQLLLQDLATSPWFLSNLVTSTG